MHVNRSMQTIACSFLLIAFTAGADARDDVRRELTSAQVAGFRAAGAAVLRARRDARASERADPTRGALAELRDLLLQLRAELTSVVPAGPITAADAVPSSVSGPETERSLRLSSIDALTARLGEFHQRAEGRARALGSRGSGKRAAVASRRAAAIARLQRRLGRLQSLPPARQLEIVDRLLERTRLRRERRSGETVASGPGPALDVQESTRTSRTPSLSTRVRHRR